MMSRDEVWRIKDICSDHLFRHLTEVNQNDTRGGYLEGKLWFSEEICKSAFALKIALISSEIRATNEINESHLPLRIDEKQFYRIHPNLLYMTRFDSKENGKPKRLKHEESSPMWKVDLKIEGGVVFWWTTRPAQIAGCYQELGKMHPDEGGGWILDMKEILHLTVINPLQRTKADGIKIKEAIDFRHEMTIFDEIDTDQREKMSRGMEKYYTKQSKSELDKICLQFNIHRMNESGGEVTLPDSDLTRYSPPITNTKSKTQGAFNLSGDISIQKCCTKISRRIHVFFSFAISSDVTVRFVLKDVENEDIKTSRLRQPDEKSMKVEKQWISFDSPTQDDDLIEEIYIKGGRILIEGYRLKDKHSTSKKIEFQYIYHEDNLDCPFCLEHPDRLTHQKDISGTSSSQEQEQGRARPGVKRRRINQNSRAECGVTNSKCASIPQQAGTREVVNLHDYPISYETARMSTITNYTSVVETMEQETHSVPVPAINMEWNLDQQSPLDIDNIDGSVPSPVESDLSINQQPLPILSFNDILDEGILTEEDEENLLLPQQEVLSEPHRPLFATSKYDPNFVQESMYGANRPLRQTVAGPLPDLVSTNTSEISRATPIDKKQSFVGESAVVADSPILRHSSRAEFGSNSSLLEIGYVERFLAPVLITLLYYFAASWQFACSFLSSIYIYYRCRWMPRCGFFIALIWFFVIDYILEECYDTFNYYYFDETASVISAG